MGLLPDDQLTLAANNLVRRGYDVVHCRGNCFYIKTQNGICGHLISNGSGFVIRKDYDFYDENRDFSSETNDINTITDVTKFALDGGSIIFKATYIGGFKKAYFDSFMQLWEDDMAIARRDLGAIARMTA
jgi:hypothetical protein